MLRFEHAPKKATNLSLNSKVLEAARESGRKEDMLYTRVY